MTHLERAKERGGAPQLISVPWIVQGSGQRQLGMPLVLAVTQASTCRKTAYRFSSPAAATMRSTQEKTRWCRDRRNRGFAGSNLPFGNIPRKAIERRQEVGVFDVPKRSLAVVLREGADGSDQFIRRNPRVAHRKHLTCSQCQTSESSFACACSIPSGRVMGP